MQFEFDSRHVIGLSQETLLPKSELAEDTDIFIVSPDALRDGLRTCQGYRTPHLNYPRHVWSEVMTAVTDLADTVSGTARMHFDSWLEESLWSSSRWGRWWKKEDPRRLLRNQVIENFLMPEEARFFWSEIRPYIPGLREAGLIVANTEPDRWNVYGIQALPDMQGYSDIDVSAFINFGSRNQILDQFDLMLGKEPVVEGEKIQFYEAKHRQPVEPGQGRQYTNRVDVTFGELLRGCWEAALVELYPDPEESGEKKMVLYSIYDEPGNLFSGNTLYVSQPVSTKPPYVQYLDEEREPYISLKEL